MKQYYGFTLIELMIVIVIISILSVIAVPSYQSYTQRARFAEVIAATAPYKTAVALALQLGVPFSELKTGLHGIPPKPPTTQNLETIQVDNGIITAIGTKLTAHATYLLKPNDDGSIWAIDGSCITLGLCEG